MKIKLLNLFLLISFFSFSQLVERQLIVGKIKSDSLEVENITVFNVSSNIGVITDVDGVFSINVREKDTLVIQGLAYLSTKYIVQKTDLDRDVLEIYLKTRINELNEVEVSPYTLTGVLEVDTQKIKTYGFTITIGDIKKLKPKDIRDTKVTNIAMPQTMSTLTGIDFKLIFGGLTKGIGKLIKSDTKRKSSADLAYEAERLKEIKSKTFAAHMHEQFSNNFFENQLKLTKDEVPLFLAFAEVPSHEIAVYLEPENHLKLVEYLISKAEEFKKQQKEE